MAMLLGGGSVVIALVEPQRGGIPTGFIVSTIGITAIVVGVRAKRAARWGSATARAFGRGGAILGSVGTALMVYAVMSMALTNVGVQLPALSLPIRDGDTSTVLQAADQPAPQAPVAASTTSPAGTAAAPSTAEDPSVAASATEPPTRDAEQAAVTQSAGTLAFVMRERFGAGPFPPELAVGMRAPQRIMLVDGTGLAPVPDDARVLYSVSDDATAWSVTVIGARFGAVATYSSAVGTVQAG
ncbi:hypothetical protein [Curtobacterium sp. MMLR14_010]|uniref:hypothetical protein n=1 Tax=Curtobacterium sp. MMLR14_010 TaxID=1898743 RepID=UPI0011145AD4|nr:hypothetical protein [Curtobacterium sp. MMLR14_010]